MCKIKLSRMWVTHSEVSPDAPLPDYLSSRCLREPKVYKPSEGL